MTDFDFWCDARIYSNLTRPGMYFVGSEALIHSTLDLCVTKLAHKGIKPHWRPIDDFISLGLLDGNSVKFPPQLTEELVTNLKVIAIDHGYDPRDFEARDQAWSKHVHTCPECSTHFKDKQEACVEGRVIWGNTAGGTGP